MSTYKHLLISMLLKEGKMVSKLFGDLLSLFGVFDMLDVITLKPITAYQGIELIFISFVFYGLSLLFLFVSLCHEQRESK
ncbi:hypothetical protein [Psychrobium sp. 1_MG-2023]|uniref:hypothetical protein n=1 Tax=Psychrobium sp. 1_MG-2023 TaxID=3062624 RepID=UPI000C330B22|nr:hypothetical protein [Psychrobium sp. 1_MG-2023]MDP2561186.1 hypothetical protein [Psychrobium sp. 1_MG-2023]PKF55308.1 hypothetical protein CW748_13920 [Alteromonadales bacterium alter-6D02]